MTQGSALIYYFERFSLSSVPICLPNSDLDFLCADAGQLPKPALKEQLRQAQASSLLRFARPVWQFLLRQSSHLLLGTYWLAAGHQHRCPNHQKGLFHASNSDKSSTDGLLEHQSQCEPVHQQTLRRDVVAQADLTLSSSFGRPSLKSHPA